MESKIGEKEELQNRLKESEDKAKELEEKLLQSEAVLKESINLLQRTTADFQNYMKQAEKERHRAASKSREDLILKFIDVYENIETAIRGMHQAGENSKNIHGLKAIARQMKKILDEDDIRRIESVGEDFDPSRHEAVEAIESGDKPDGRILEEVQSGYMIDNNVIRHAKVVVARREVEKNG